MKHCIDCGDAPVNHTFEWTSAVLDRALSPLAKPLEVIRRLLEKAFATSFYTRALPALMHALVALHLARFADAPDAKTSARSRVMWEEALRRGISIREFRLFGIGRDVFLSSFGGKTQVFLDLPRPNLISTPGLIWMNDKELLRERLAAKNIPTPKGGVAISKTDVKKLFKSLRPPLVTKPEEGSRSRHTTTHIETLPELLNAFKKAAILSPWVVIEEEEDGFVYRGTVVGGNLIAVLRREPPMVTGDGVHTVRELMEIENKNPKRDGVIFHKLQIDAEGVAELARQRLTLDSVPAKDQFVSLSQKASRGIGGGTIDVTDIVHEDIKTMLEDAAKVIADPLIGFDFIFSAVTKSWKEQSRGGIIEANSMPFIDLHHFPLVGAARNVAAELWSLVYPESNF